MTNEVVAKVASMGDAALTKVLEYVEATESFVVEQAPLLIQEILAWGFAENLFYASIWGALGLVLLICVVKVCRFFNKEELDGEAAVLVGIFGGGISMLLFVVSSCYILEAVKISVAPRLYLLEVFGELL